MIAGVSHLTFAVKDLDASFRFYTGVLGFQAVARWSRGAYLTAGDLWIALALDAHTRSGPLPEETHVAFAISADDFSDMAERLHAADVVVWRENRSEGKSLYVLDPDGHKLEIHVGTLASRMAMLEEASHPDMTLYNNPVDTPDSA